MDEKFLDVVDESGKIIKVESRKNIHDKGLLHKEVHVWFVDTQNKIIFQHRGKNKETYPDSLDATVGGHVEIGSDYLDTALKESLEETGAEINKKDLILIDKIRSTSHDEITDKTNNVLRAIYVYKLKAPINSLREETGKASGFEAYSAEQLDNLSEEEKKKFIPAMINDEQLKLYKKIIINCKKNEN